MKDYSDEQLAADYLKGNKNALEILIKRYLKQIYSFSFRFAVNQKDAEDITQEVFVKVWRNLKKFRPRKGSFKTWLFTIAKNTALDFLKKPRKSIPLSEFMENIPDSALLPDELSERRNSADILKRVLRKLSPKYRLVLLLRYDNHLTFQEIAQTLKESINTVKSRHRRALVLLKKLLRA